jgi:hypothetical protein
MSSALWMKRKSETIHNPRVSEKQQGAYILSIFLLISIVSNYNKDRGGGTSCKRKEKFVGLVCLQKPTSLREEARKERLEASDAIAILLRCPQKRRDRAKELRTLALFSESLFFFFFLLLLRVCARASVRGQTRGLDKAVYGVTLHFDGFLVLRQKPNTLLPYYS